MVPWDGVHNIDLTRSPPLDAGNVRPGATLEATQRSLGEVVAGILAHGALPVVLGGGHETAYGHYLGYVNARKRVGIVNLDAHLDVRPCVEEGGHSGSPFRQALEHPDYPLPEACYVCLGAQPQATSRQHWAFVTRHGGTVKWCAEVQADLETLFVKEVDRLSRAGCGIYVSIDADVVRAADVPGVSAPNPLGLPGSAVAACARLAGMSPAVTSLDVVEINPSHDCDGRSARWGASVVWHFLTGLAARVA
jgi:formiminoglutamase